MLADKKLQTKHTRTPTHTHRYTLTHSPGQFCNHILFAGTKNYEMPSMIFHLFCTQTLCMPLCVCMCVCVCVWALLLLCHRHRHRHRALTMMEED